MADSLEERLKTHSNAFDGLLSLIPAQYYYDEATQDQWQQKKKSKKEATEARLAKLDPDSSNTDTYNNAGASAKDVMETRAKSAKKVSLPGKIENSTGPLPKQTEATSKKGNTEDSTEATNITENVEESKHDSKQSPEKKSKPAAKKVLTPEEQELKEKRRAEMKEKLAKKIELMREKRKAPGTKAGGPVKSREQMLTERKRREEYKRQEKLKRKRDDVESDKSDDEENDDEDENAEEEDEGVLFGTIQFKDGTRMTSDLQNIRNGVDRKKKKGPANKDIKAHLLKLEAKRRKLDQLSPEERKAQEELELWKSLMNQAEGVKVKDNEKLLRKSLKRKEKQKLKSEIEWRERKQNVKDTINARQKRKEANLKSRRENKGKKSKNIPKLRQFTGTVQKGGKGKDGKKRAGFEGNAKSKGKGKPGK